MKQRLITLENARSELEKEVVKNSEIIKNSQGDVQKVSELEQKNSELLQEKDKIEKDMTRQSSGILKDKKIETKT